MFGLRMFGWWYYSKRPVPFDLTEQDERSRESTEQWREFHYDGLHPSYEYNRHTIWWLTDTTEQRNKEEVHTTKELIWKWCQMMPQA